jgi:hypothetical protein
VGGDWNATLFLTNKEGTLRLLFPFHLSSSVPLRNALTGLSPVLLPVLLSVILPVLLHSLFHCSLHAIMESSSSCCHRWCLCGRSARHPGSKFGGPAHPLQGEAQQRRQWRAAFREEHQPGRTQQAGAASAPSEAAGMSCTPLLFLHLAVSYQIFHLQLS